MLYRETDFFLEIFWVLFCRCPGSTSWSESNCFELSWRSQVNCPGTLSR